MYLNVDTGMIPYFIQTSFLKVATIINWIFVHKVQQKLSHTSIGTLYVKARQPFQNQ